MKKIFLSLIILLLGAGAVRAESLAGRMSGYILLQVEQNGEAWYVYPGDGIRHYLGRPAEAWELMRDLGRGISDADLERIPVGVPGTAPGADRDGDGLSDGMETALGTDPARADSDGDGFSDREELVNGHDPSGPGQLAYDPAFARRQAGWIFLQVEKNGEAWYVYPGDNRRYYLGRPADAFQIMRSLGVGISDTNLAAIGAGSAGYAASSLESKIQMAVNDEREAAGLARLKWNSELAAVARRHSEDLARENEGFTAIGRVCDYPIIHHEGTVFGLYHADRLHNSSIYYSSQSGENIALVSGVNYVVTYKAGDPVADDLEECDSWRYAREQSFLASLDRADTEAEKISAVRSELADRTQQYLAGRRVTVSELNWHEEDEVVEETVQGWMDSPGHRANILTANYDEAGVGVAKVNGYVISTQIFIKRADCGYQGGPCCKEKGYYPYCFVGYTCSAEKCVSAD